MSKDEEAVNEKVVADATTTESAPVENPSEVAEDEAESEIIEDDSSFEEALAEDEVETDSKVEPEKATAEPEEQKPESQPQGKAEERKQQLKSEIDDLSKSNGVDPNSEIRELVARRNALRELEETRLREAQIASEQGLLQEVNPETGDYYSPAEAERLARQQTLESEQQNVAQQRYALEVQQNQTAISNEATRALHDFPMFDSNSPEYDEQLAVQADQLLGQSLITDQNGTLVGSNVSPYQLYKTIADSTRAYAAKGEANAQKATETMLANVDTGGDSSQATPAKADPLLDGFDEEAARWTE